MLALCFSVIALFGSPLHDHDLDSSHVDLDCISCHLVQSNIGLENSEPDFSPLAQVAQRVSFGKTELFTVSLPSAISRAPPQSFVDLIYYQIINFC
jgi:hypothetical protein